MRKSATMATERSGSFAQRVIAAGMAVVLAVGLAPLPAGQAVADDGLQAASGDIIAQSILKVQHFEANNTTGLHVVTADEEGGQVELVSSKNGEYVYKGYAQGDRSHFGSYSLYTHLITDGNGKLTGVNLTSDVDTFYSKWGRYLQKTKSFLGYLPDYVTFDFDRSANVSKDESTGTTTVTAKLNNTKTYGFAGGDAKFYRGANASSIGTDVTTKSTSSSGGRGGKGGNSETPAVDYGYKTSFAAGTPTNLGQVNSAAEFTTPEGEADVNLIEITYQLGYDKTKFVVYACLDENADAWADAAEATMVDYAAEKGQPTQDTGLTNRDRWSYYMLSQLGQRELSGYRAMLAGDDAHGLQEIDVISGATKTTAPMKGAIEAAVKSGYVKSIAEEVDLWLDKGESDQRHVSADYSDQSTAVKNADGSYTINVKVITNSPYISSENHSPKMDYLMTYENLGKLDANDMDALASSITIPENDKLDAKYISSKYVPAHVYGGNYTYGSDKVVTNVYNTEFSDDAAGISWEFADFMPGVVTAENPNPAPAQIDSYNFTVPAGTSHVLLAESIGHAHGYIAYDVDELVAATNVAAVIEKMNATDSASVAAARKSYDALAYDVQGLVTNRSKLISAEAVLAEKAAAEAKAAAEKAAKEAAEKAAAAKVVKVGESKVVSSNTYKVTKVATSSAQGSVTLTAAKNAKTVSIPATVTLNDGLQYKVTQVAAKSFTASKIRSVTLGANVSKLAAKAFTNSKATKVTVKNTSLTKAKVKNAFKNAKITTVKVPSKKLKAYKKIFTKKITGNKKTIKVKK